jgi:hypothetical protein
LQPPYTGQRPEWRDVLGDLIHQNRQLCIDLGPLLFEQLDLFKQAAHLDADSVGEKTDSN